VPPLFGMNAAGARTDPGPLAGDHARQGPGYFQLGFACRRRWRRFIGAFPAPSASLPSYAFSVDWVTRSDPAAGV
jgi:hypothetical protein